MTSLRSARRTTSMPSPAAAKAKIAPEPHWPAETQTPSPPASITTIAKQVGLKTCLAPRRIANLLATAITAATGSGQKASARIGSESDSPEIRALRGSKRGSRLGPLQSHWVPRAAARVAAVRRPSTSKSSPRVPQASSAVSTPICCGRGSRRRSMTR